VYELQKITVVLREEIYYLTISFAGTDNSIDFEVRLDKGASAFNVIKSMLMLSNIILEKAEGK
jgi:hypothetical protein